MTKENDTLIARIFERRHRNAFFAFLHALAVLPSLFIGIRAVPLRRE